MDAQNARRPEAPRTLDLTTEAQRLRPRIDDLLRAASPSLRRAAQTTWIGRMINEHESSFVFQALAPQLREAGASDERVEACARMADEEREHGVLCGAVALALGAEPRADVPAPAPLPRHADVAPIEAALRNVLSVCCLSETVAVSLIQAERLEMPSGDIRELLTRILADEVGHARFGWTWLDEVAPSLDAAARARLGDYLAVALAHLERHEIAHIRGSTAFPREGVALGLCDGGEARSLFYETVREVIVPRLEARGLPAARAWETRGAA